VFEALYARYTVNTGKAGEDVELVIDSDGFMKVREAPTGFLCIRRSVFDRLIAAYPQFQYVPDWPEGTYPEGGVHYRFFDVMVDPESRRYLSEDYGFCRLWEKIGGEIYVDANSNLSHQGGTALYGGFRSHIKSRAEHSGGSAQGLAHAHRRVRKPQAKPVSSFDLRTCCRDHISTRCRQLGGMGR
jgi:hypothetical protein